MSNTENNQLTYQPPVEVNKVGIKAPIKWLSKGVSDVNDHRLKPVASYIG